MCRSLHLLDVTDVHESVRRIRSKWRRCVNSLEVVTFGGFSSFTIALREKRPNVTTSGQLRQQLHFERTRRRYQCKSVKSSGCNDLCPQGVLVRPHVITNFYFFLILLISLERLQTSKTTTFGRPPTICSFWGLKSLQENPENQNKKLEIRD